MFFLTSIDALSLSGWEGATLTPEFVKIQTNFGGCTGTRISNQGHILTARHCLNECLIQSGAVDEERLFPEEGWRSPKLFHFPNGNPAFCDLEINGIPKRVEVLSASAAFMIPLEQSSLSRYARDLHQELMDQNFFHTGDYAIVKDENSQRQQCRKISMERPIATQEVHYFGFPGQSRGGRPEGRESDGESFLRSDGQVVASITQNPCIRGSIERLVDKYDRPEIILSTVDILPGASGSSLLNSAGEIVGLLNSSYTNGAEMYETYCPGSAVAIAVESLFEQMAQRLSQSEIDEYFSCTN